MGKEAINERKINEKKEIVAPMFDLRKLEMLLLETMFFLRTKWGFLKKIERISPDREVLISRTVLRQAGWGSKDRGRSSKIDNCSCIIDNGFNGGALCSFNWMRKYKRYLSAI